MKALVKEIQRGSVSHDTLRVTPRFLLLKKEEGKEISPTDLIAKFDFYLLSHIIAFIFSFRYLMSHLPSPPSRQDPAQLYM